MIRIGLPIDATVAADGRAGGTAGAGSFAAIAAATLRQVVAGGAFPFAGAAEFAVGVRRHEAAAALGARRAALAFTAAFAGAVRAGVGAAAALWRRFADRQAPRSPRASERRP
jgi:hypothetical protein